MERLNQLERLIKYEIIGRSKKVLLHPRKSLDVSVLNSNDNDAFLIVKKILPEKSEKSLEKNNISPIKQNSESPKGRVYSALQSNKEKRSRESDLILNQSCNFTERCTQLQEARSIFVAPGNSSSAKTTVVNLDGFCVGRPRKSPKRSQLSLCKNTFIGRLKSRRGSSSIGNNYYLNNYTCNVNASVHHDLSHFPVSYLVDSFFPTTKSVNSSPLRKPSISPSHCRFFNKPVHPSSNSKSSVIGSLQKCVCQKSTPLNPCPTKISTLIQLPGSPCSFNIPTQSSTSSQHSKLSPPRLLEQKRRRFIS